MVNTLETIKQVRFSKRKNMCLKTKAMCEEKEKEDKEGTQVKFIGIVQSVINVKD